MAGQSLPDDVERTELQNDKSVKHNKMHDTALAILKQLALSEYLDGELAQAFLQILPQIRWLAQTDIQVPAIHHGGEHIHRPTGDQDKEQRVD